MKNMEALRTQTLHIAKKRYETVTDKVENFLTEILDNYMTVIQCTA